MLLDVKKENQQAILREINRLKSPLTLEVGGTSSDGTSPRGGGGPPRLNVYRRGEQPPPIERLPGEGNPTTDNVTSAEEEEPHHRQL